VFAAAIVKDEPLLEAIWTKFVPETLKTGHLKPVPKPIIIEKGLEKVEEGIEMVKGGR